MSSAMPGPIRLARLAEELGLSFEGEGATELSGVASLDEAGPSDLAFARSAAFADALAGSRAGAVIAPPDLDTAGRPTLRSHRPGLDFARAVRLLVPERRPPPGIDESARVDADARVDPQACIGPGCVVGAGARVGPGSWLHAGVILYPGAVVGADCTLHAGCRIGADSAIGDRVILHPGVVLGSDGFGYVADERGAAEKVPQVGRVVVEDDVEIGANSTVDRGTLGETRIGRNTKIDNLVQIAHNCRIGEGVLIAAQVGLAGSTVVERGAILMGQVGVAGHLTIGERAFVGAKCGVHADVPAGARVWGYPQREERSWHRVTAALTRLPDLLKRVREIERKLGLRGGDEE